MCRVLSRAEGWRSDGRSVDRLTAGIGARAVVGNLENSREMRERVGGGQRKRKKESNVAALEALPKRERGGRDEAVEVYGDCRSGAREQRNTIGRGSGSGEEWENPGI